MTSNQYPSPSLPPSLINDTILTSTPTAFRYEQTKKGQLPFLLTLHNRRSETITELLDANYDALDACDYRGNTAIHYASEHSNPDGAKMVLKLYVSVLLSFFFSCFFMSLTLTYPSILPCCII
jgi:ankyrin repeat protein